MKKLLLIALLAMSGAAMASPASFTGRQETVTTVNGNMAFKCWYRTARGDIVTIVVPYSQGGCHQYADID